MRKKSLLAVVGILAALVVVDRAMALTGGRGILFQALFNAGTQNAVDRTAYDKIKDWISVKDYGAVGNGTTNDSSAVSTALTNAGAGQLINFPCPGTYLTNSYGTLGCGVYFTPNGTSMRSVPDKLSDTVSVMDFGADPTGVTDSTAAIQAAFDAHRDIYFPEGPGGTTATYLINGDSAFVGGGKDCVDGGIAPHSNSRIWINSNAILKAKTNSTGNYCVLGLRGVDSVFIYGGTIQGERATHIGAIGEFGYGVGIVGSTNVYLYNVNVKDFWGDGIVIDQSRPANVVSDNIVISNIIVSNNRRNGMSVISGTDVLVSNSVFQTSNGTAPQAGIDIEPGVSGNTTKRIKIEGCAVNSNTSSGIQVQGLNGGTNLGDITIANNTLLNNGYRGISLYQAQNGGVNIVGNTVRGSTDSGISAEWSTEVLITGNRTDGNTVNGIQVIGPSVDVTVSGNETSGNTQHGILVGNTADGAGSQISVINNTSIGNTLDGIRALYLTDGTISGNTVIGNSQGTNNTNDGILVSLGTNVLIASNMIRKGGGAKKQKYGLDFNGGVRYLVTANDLNLSGATGDVLNFAPTSVTFLGNNYTTATPSIERGSCTLNGASPAICTAAVFVGSVCLATPQGATAAAATHTLATNNVAGTLTVTGANGLTDVVNYWCF